MINYGQGVPFYQMGTDILRSKSLDRNSFDSGDWFNTVDFTLDTHNWARGMPPAWDNKDRWEAQRRFLSAPAIRVEKSHMRRTHQGFIEQLRIRYSTPLFRMVDADDIHRRVVFHNTGPDQVPGLIVMSISDAACGGDDLDPALDGLVVVFNATLEPITVDSPIASPRVHPFSTSGERVDGTRLTVPALGSGVFVKPQRGARGDVGCNTRI
jgi:pullulanase/glycogen debranching enzyme